MSPEQATGDSSVGAASDIWSLGCVLYEMLAGTPPFDGSTPQAILGRIVSGSHEPVTKQRRTTPAHVTAAVARALEPVPADRFGSARDFALALRNPRFRHGETGVRRRSMGRVAVAAAGFYALGLLTWWLMSPSTDGSEDRPSVSFLIPGITASGFGRSLAISPDGTLLAATTGNLSVRRIGDLEAPRDLRTSAIQQVGDVNALFRMGLATFGNVSGRPWDVSPVDGRFLLVRNQARQGVAGARVVLNWTQELLRAMEQ